MDITLDTNVIGPLACPGLYPTCPDMPSIDSLRNLILGGTINAYLSEASTSLEAISNDERVDLFLRQWASINNPIALPDPSPERKRVFAEALRLGVKVLHAPRLALGALISFPDESWATDRQFPQKERLNRYHSYIRSQPHSGVDRLKEFGAELVTIHGLSTDHLKHLSSLPSGPTAEKLMWVNGIIAEYDSPKKFPTKKKFLSEFRDLVAEWFDLDIQASHYAYGNDYLCTFDSAKNAGASAIMHTNRKSRNTTQFGIQIVSPRELVNLVLP